jgi:hypothetical protein
VLVVVARITSGLAGAGGAAGASVGTSVAGGAAGASVGSAVAGGAAGASVGCAAHAVSSRLRLRIMASIANIDRFIFFSLEKYFSPFGLYTNHIWIGTLVDGIILLSKSQ